MNVSRSTTLSLKAASAVTSLMVEQGMNPLLSPSFWLTMVRTRPLSGSTTTILPACEPRASTAARRMAISSPSTLSPTVGSTLGVAGAFLRPVFFLVAVDLEAWARTRGRIGSRPDRSSAGRITRFIVYTYRTSPGARREEQTSDSSRTDGLLSCRECRKVNLPFCRYRMFSIGKVTKKVRLSNDLAQPDLG